MPPVRVVYVAVSCETDTEDGSPVSLREGDVWAADDPLVKDRPDLFCEHPPGPRFPRRTAPYVEQATREPGERRNTRRG
jgi:hypothetical protein